MTTSVPIGRFIDAIADTCPDEVVSAWVAVVETVDSDGHHRTCLLRSQHESLTHIRGLLDTGSDHIASKIRKSR